MEYICSLSFIQGDMHRDISFHPYIDFSQGYLEKFSSLILTFDLIYQTDLPSVHVGGMNREGSG